MGKKENLFGRLQVAILTYSAGLFIATIATIVATFSPSFWLLLSFRTLSSIGFSMMFSMPIVVISDIYPPEHRGFAISVQQAGASIGGSF
jgi:MFS family permease